LIIRPRPQPAQERVFFVANVLDNIGRERDTFKGEQKAKI
jgi:hypothetical protein